MADQTQNTVHIGRLNLRIPGADAETGQRVGNQLVETLAGQMPEGIRGHIGALAIRVPVDPSASESEIVTAVSKSIIGALSKANRFSSISSPPGEQRN